ncbi:VOC family protein [Nocardioides pakistanensis]
MAARALTRTEASRAVEHLGWRYVLGSLRAAVAVADLEQAVEVLAAVVRRCGPVGAGHLTPTPRGDRLDLALQTPDAATVTGRDVELAEEVTGVLRELGLETAPGGRARSVQVLEIAVDALDIARIRPFWKAVLGYTDEPGYDGPTDALVDPLREGPAVWFQQMDEPRPQRNRIHLDISVPHDEADARIRAALDAGGVLVSDARARAFWVLADAEGNEVCITTWQDRD